MGYLDSHGLDTFWAKIKTYVGGHAGNAAVVIAQNVASSAWSADATYSDYPYRATLTVSGMTSSHVPEVVFDGTDEATEKIAEHCVSYSGGVYIYASDDVGAVTAQTIKGTKGL